jgi:hypothetical protein
VNNLSFLRDEIYSLKMSYGVEGAVYRTVIGDTDLTTGKKSLTRQKIPIDKIIVMPIKFETVQFISAAFLKAGREFAYGGGQDKETKRVILDGDDLPDAFEIEPEDYLVLNHKKYEITYFEELEEKAGYQLIVQRLEGAVVNEIHEVAVYQSLRFLNKARTV